MLLGLAAITFFALTVDSRPTRAVHDFSQINCYIKHLKAESKLDANYPEFNNASQIQNCSEIIKSNNKKLYENIALQIQSESPLSESAECIVDEMKLRDSADDYMKRLVFSTSNTLTVTEKQQIDLKIKLNTKMTLKNAAKSCKAYEKVYEKEFDRFFKIFSEGESDKVKDFCVRKHVVDNKLMDFSVYNVTIFPENVNATQIVCAKILEKFAEGFTKGLIKTLRDDGKGFDEVELECFLGKLQKVKFMDKLLVIGVLSEIDITEEQKNAERKKYVEFMGKAAPFDCVL